MANVSISVSRAIYGLGAGVVACARDTADSAETLTDVPQIVTGEGASPWTAA